MDDDGGMKSNCLLWKRAVASMALVVIMAGCGASRSAPRTVAAAPDDQTLKTRVQTSLMNAPGVNPSAVTTDVAQGVATLSGTVRSQAEADAAVAAARRVDGVKDVRSNLKIQ
jgi:hyperosmotically inducible protein